MLTDIRCAKAAGMRSGFANWKQSNITSEADYIFTNPKDILSRMEGGKMRVWQRARRSVWRKPVKSILLLLAVCAISLLFLSGMASRNANIAAKDIGNECRKQKPASSGNAQKNR